jgi:hypothetical protein
VLAPQVGEEQRQRLGVVGLDRHDDLRGTSSSRSAYSCRIAEVTSSGVVSGSTLSTDQPLRPTSRPRRTKNACTDASRSSSWIAMASKSSGLSATICCLAMARSAAWSWSRSRAAASKFSSLAAACISEPSRASTGAVSPSRKSASRSTRSRCSSMPITPVHGAAHRSMWWSRQGRPVRAARS